MVPWAEIAPTWPLASHDAAAVRTGSTAVAARAAALGRPGVSPAPPSDAAAWAGAVAALGVLAGVPGAAA